MPKFLLDWNGLKFPAKRKPKYGTRIERYLKSPNQFQGARLIEVDDPDELLKRVEDLQNIDSCGYVCDEDPIKVIDELDKVHCGIYLYPIKWAAIEERYKHENNI